MNNPFPHGMNPFPQNDHRFTVFYMLHDFYRDAYHLDPEITTIAELNTFIETWTRKHFPDE